MLKITKKLLVFLLMIILAFLFTVIIIYKLPDYGKATYVITLFEDEFYDYSNDEYNLQQYFPLGEEIEIELFSTRYKNIFKPHDGKVVIFINGERYVCHFPFIDSYNKKVHLPILSLFEMWYHRIINDEFLLLSFRKYDDIEYNARNNRSYISIQYGMKENMNIDKNTFIVSISDENGIYGRYVNYTNIYNFLGFE